MFYCPLFDCLDHIKSIEFKYEIRKWYFFCANELTPWIIALKTY